METTAEKRRFRFSVKFLMIVVALCALLLAPIVWVYRQNQRLRLAELMAMREAERARAEAERARYVTQVRAAEAAFNATSVGEADRPVAGSLAANHEGGLWAALTLNHSVFEQGATKDLSVEFTLVNDSDKAIDPKIAESRININGQDLADSARILGNVPRDTRYGALLLGDHLRFESALGDHFNRPGVYRVSWRGEGFQSPEVVFRVLPRSGQ
jgi:hypothetical protein